MLSAAFNPPPPPLDERPDPVLENPIRMPSDAHAKRLLQIHRAIGMAALAGLLLPLITATMIVWAWAHAGSGTLMIDLAGRVAALLVAGFVGAIAAGMALAGPPPKPDWLAEDGRFRSARAALIGLLVASGLAFAVQVGTGLAVSHGRLGTIEWLLTTMLGGLAAFSIRAIGLDSKLDRLREAAPITFSKPLPAPRRAEDLERRRRAVAEAAREHLDRRHRTEIELRDRRRPVAVAAMVSPVIVAATWVFRGTPTSGAMAMYWGVGGIQAVAAMIAFAGGVWTWKVAHRPTAGLAAAAAALAVAAQMQMIWFGDAWAWRDGFDSFALLGVGLLVANLAAVAVGAWWMFAAKRAQKPGPSVPHLLEALRSPDFGIRHDAHAALIQATGLDLPADSTVWRHWVQDALERTGRLPRRLPNQPPTVASRSNTKTSAPR